MALFRLTDDELEIVQICLDRCRSEANRQVDKGAAEYCGGFAWWATRLCKARIERLLDRIEKEKADG